MKPSVPFTSLNHGFPQGTIPIISSDIGPYIFRDDPTDDGR